MRKLFSRTTLASRHPSFLRAIDRINSIEEGDWIEYGSKEEKAMIAFLDSNGFKRGAYQISVDDFGNVIFTQDVVQSTHSPLSK